MDTANKSVRKLIKEKYFIFKNNYGKKMLLLNVGVVLARKRRMRRFAKLMRRKQRLVSISFSILINEMD